MILKILCDVIKVYAVQNASLKHVHNLIDIIYYLNVFKEKKNKLLKGLKRIISFH